MNRRSRWNRNHFALAPLSMAVVVSGTFAHRNTAPDWDLQYQLIDVGPLPSIADDIAAAINNSGQISFWRPSAGNTIHACTWKEGQTQDLGTLQGDMSSVSRDLNRRGEIVGWSVSGKNLVDSRAIMHGFLYSQGHMMDLGTLGGRDSQAKAINDEGRVVGVSSLADNKKHAFLSEHRKLKDLGGLQGGSYSEANAINRRGAVAGASETANHSIHAVLWTGGTLQDLGTLPGGARSRALGLNDLGDVIGFSEVEGGKIHAFIYETRRMYDLGSLGDEPIRANAINNHGQIVGVSGVDERTGHAFLWRNGRMADLNRHIGAKPRWRLTEAYDINDRGDIVCAAMRLTAPSERRLLLLKRLKTQRSNARSIVG